MMYHLATPFYSVVPLRVTRRSTSRSQSLGPRLFGLPRRPLLDLSPLTRRHSFQVVYQPSHSKLRTGHSHLLATFFLQPFYKPTSLQSLSALAPSWCVLPASSSLYPQRMLTPVCAQCTGYPSHRHRQQAAGRLCVQWSLLQPYRLASDCWCVLANT